MVTFEKIVKVTRKDLDDLDHVNNVRYVQWIQDISKEHWETKAPKAIQNNVVWVVKQHLVNYKSAAKAGDSILMKTHISNTEGAISTRVVEMYNNQTKTLLVQARTEWCLLNATSFRPMRISDEIQNVFKSE